MPWAHRPASPYTSTGASVPTAKCHNLGLQQRLHHCTFDQHSTGFGAAALTITKFYPRCGYAGTAQLEQCNEEDKLFLCLSLTLQHHEASCKAVAADKHWHWAHDKHPKEFTQAAATEHSNTRPLYHPQHSEGEGVYAGALHTQMDLFLERIQHKLNINYKHSHRNDIRFSSSSTFKLRCIVCNPGCWKGFSMSRCSSGVFHAHWPRLTHPYNAQQHKSRPCNLVSEQMWEQLYLKHGFQCCFRANSEHFHSSSTQNLGNLGKPAKNIFLDI